MEQSIIYDKEVKIKSNIEKINDELELTLIEYKDLKDRQKKVEEYKEIDNKKVEFKLYKNDKENLDKELEHKKQEENKHKEKIKKLEEEINKTEQEYDTLDKESIELENSEYKNIILETEIKLSEQQINILKQHPLLNIKK